MPLIVSKAREFIDKGDFHNAQMSVISDMIKSECTNDLTKSFLFVPILSEHNNNKEKFFQNLYGFACTCKCE
jgi:hypothetical protein